MYYNNLNSITQVLNRLFSPRCLCYGAPLFFNVSNEYTMTKNEWLYLGAFQWIHTKKLYDYLGYNKVGYDSFDAESFIPNKVEKHHDLIGSLNSNFAYANVDRLYDLVSDTDFFNYVLYSQYEDGFDEFCIDIFNKF